MKLPCIFVFIFSTSFVYSQEKITIAENSIKISSKSDENLYFGFCEGDEIIFNFEEKDGKTLGALEISEYVNGNSIFSELKTKKISNKSIKIQNTGIYKFRFNNSVLLANRYCNIKIQRIPKYPSTKFNTTVYWKAVQDTTYSNTETKYISKSDTLIKEVYASTPKISSTHAINGNKNYQIIDFTLPENTKYWSFYIACGDKGAKELERGKNEFAKRLTNYILDANPMAALALTGFSVFNQIQGEDNVKYWFLNDEKSVELFQKNTLFKHYKKGDVMSEASQMLFPLKGKIYLALMNDNTIEPIKVNVNVTAIQILTEYKTKTEELPNIKSIQKPYLKY